MSKSYLIKLKPLDYYFFGGEETFNSGAKGLTNYLVKSNILPQQTGLLGLIRHALYGKYAIGESFSQEKADFGVIEKISPVFLIDAKGAFLFSAPLNINNDGALVPISFSNSNHSFVNDRWVSGVPQASNYNAKDGLESFWLTLGSSSLISEKCIFKKAMHVGINKEKRKENNTDQDAFYKQEFVTLSDGYSFGFFVDLQDEVKPSDIPKTMPFGGEKRTFQVSVTNADQKWAAAKTNINNAFKEIFPGNKQCITLLSDTYVKEPDSLYNLIDFAVTDERPFRNITTAATVKNFAALTMKQGHREQPGNSLVKNNTVAYLLKRGSVLFANATNKEAIEKLLKNTAFEKIGYNQYISNS